MSVWLWKRAGTQTVYGGVSAVVTGRALVVNADNMRDGVLTRCYTRLQVGLWVLDALVRLGPVRIGAGVQVKHGKLTTEGELTLVWSHK